MVHKLDFERRYVANYFCFRNWIMIHFGDVCVVTTPIFFFPTLVRNKCIGTHGHSLGWLLDKRANSFSFCFADDICCVCFSRKSEVRHPLVNLQKHRLASWDGGWLNQNLCPQVKRVSQCTNTSRTGQWMRSSRTCPAALRRTAASWRAPSGSAAFCGRSSSGACSGGKYSTSLSTESRDHQSLPAFRHLERRPPPPPSWAGGGTTLQQGYPYCL